MSLSDITDAIAARLRTIAGLNAYPYAPGTLAPPAAVVQLPREIDFDLVYGRGADTLTFPVMVLVGAVDERASQSNLSRYLDPATGLKSVLDGDLGGAVQDATVQRATGVGSYTVGGVDYLGAVFELEVVA